MGNVFSGGRLPRNGKVAVDALPTVRLTHTTLYAVCHSHEPYLRIEGRDWATAILGFQSWPVHLDYTPLHFGGQRRWLICPACSGRRSVLHIDAGTLRCRKCLGGRYESQHENIRSRRLRKANKLRVKLGWSSGVLDSIGLRPKGMHESTHRQLCSELNALTDSIVGGTHDWLNRANSALDRRDIQRSTKKGRRRRARALTSRN